METKVAKEIKRGDRTYQLTLSPDAPVGECLDVIIELWQWISKVNADAFKAAVDTKNQEQPIQE